VAMVLPLSFIQNIMSLERGSKEDQTQKGLMASCERSNG
jgi:hypothetical protein